MGFEPEPGDRVRVRADCPHTLPAYARMLVGTVLGPTEDGMLSVSFGDDRTFPIAARWLMPAPDVPDDEPHGEPHER